MSHGDMLHRIAQQAEGMRRHGFEGVAQTLNDAATALRAEVEAHETARKCMLANEQELVRADGIIGELRADLEKARAELAEKTARIERLGEILNDVHACNDKCDLGAVLAWVDPKDRERIRGLVSAKDARIRSLAGHIIAIGNSHFRACSRCVPNDRWNKPGYACPFHDACDALALSPPPPQPETKEAPKTT